MAARARAAADRVAASELAIFVQNHAGLYRQQVLPILENLARKVRAGTYSRAKSLKLWRYLADNGAKLFHADAFMAGKWSDSFSVATRELAADELAAHYHSALEDKAGRHVPEDNPKRGGFRSESGDFKRLDTPAKRVAYMRRLVKRWKATRQRGAAVQLESVGAELFHDTFRKFGQDAAWDLEDIARAAGMLQGTRRTHAPVGAGGYERAMWQGTGSRPFQVIDPSIDPRWPVSLHPSRPAAQREVAWRKGESPLARPRIRMASPRRPLPNPAPKPPTIQAARALGVKLARAVNLGADGAVDALERAKTKLIARAELAGNSEAIWKALSAGYRSTFKGRGSSAPRQNPRRKAPAKRKRAASSSSSGAPAGAAWVKVGKHRVLAVRRKGGALAVYRIAHPPGERGTCALLGAIKGHRTFTGRNPSKVKHVRGPSRVPDVVYRLGELEAVQYRSDKWDGKARSYVHKFGRKRPGLCSDAGGRLWVVGGGYKVRAAGIVG